MARGLRGARALDEVVESASDQPEVDWAGLGERVARARRRAGLTGVQLAERTGLANDQVSKVENGVRRLNVRELPAVAATLGVSIGHLLGMPARPRLAMAHRLAPAAPTDRDQGARQRAMRLLELEDALGARVPPPPPAPSTLGAHVMARIRQEFPNRPRNQGEAERQGRRIAELVRNELCLGGLEIGDLPGLLERVFGLDVALSPLGAATDGLYARGEGVALVVASSSFSAGHVRFTLAHELGHHLCGDGRDVIAESTEDMFAGGLLEKRVNSFAAHFLMPASGVQETVAWVGDGELSERVLVALMDRFGVSMRALLWQLSTLGLLRYDDVTRLRQLSVGALVTRYREVAPNGGYAQSTDVVRAPERLLGTAVRAAQAQKVGLAVVAELLERADDDDLWDEIMGSVDDLIDERATAPSSAQ